MDSTDIKQPLQAQNNHLNVDDLQLNQEFVNQQLNEYRAIQAQNQKNQLMQSQNYYYNQQSNQYQQPNQYPGPQNIPMQDLSNNQAQYQQFELNNWNHQQQNQQEPFELKKFLVEKFKNLDEVQKIILGIIVLIWLSIIYIIIKSY